MTDRRAVPSLDRRHVLGGLAAFAVLAPGAALAQADAARARGMAFGGDFGLAPYFGDQGVEETDQSELFQAAVDEAAAMGVELVLASGRYFAGNVVLPRTIAITGLSGGVEINAVSGGAIFAADGKSDITLENLRFQGNPQAAPNADTALLAFAGCERLRLKSLRLGAGPGNGITLENCSGRLASLDIAGFEAAAVFARNSHDLIIRDCRVARCGNGGILVWGEGDRLDGTIVSGNHIGDIAARAGGNGQNGNGVNVFKANGVVVSDNVIENCAFTAIRLNSTTDTQVSGNICLNSGEVAIFSEFAFSGSIIANNIVDGAAQGISITNFNEGGRLAICAGNIVRNIAPSSLVNPDTVPVGISAEADTVISGNVVEAVPGLGIGAGWGPYLRDVVVSGNVVRDVEIGIGVSVAEGAGKALVSANLVSEARRAAIAGLAWSDMVSDDLVRDAARFPNVTVSGNSLS
ncbi:MAG: TIGR03808 family TAT-translocated repetitive protein [Devosia sp.]